jgi:hypothetical protein
VTALTVLEEPAFEHPVQANAKIAKQAMVQVVVLLLFIMDLIFSDCNSSYSGFHLHDNTYGFFVARVVSEAKNPGGRPGFC